jgi:phosphonate transport system ATP-binding protein
VIRVRALEKVYPGGARALRGVDLDVAAGEFVALIGPSGAGKSTLLRCVAGLVEPTAGEVAVDGRRASGVPPGERRRMRASVGFVFQQFNLLRRLTVLENTLVGRLGHTAEWRALLGWFSATDRARAHRVLARVELEGLADRRVDTLSGGQQQRVAIARALVQEPRILLADEPMASLDPALSRTVMELLRRINREDGITVVTSLHVLDLARSYGRRIVGLRAGQVVHDGPADAFGDAAARRVFEPVAA